MRRPGPAPGTSDASPGDSAASQSRGGGPTGGARLLEGTFRRVAPERALDVWPRRVTPCYFLASSHGARVGARRSLSWVGVGKPPRPFPCLLRTTRRLLSCPTAPARFRRAPRPSRSSGDVPTCCHAPSGLRPAPRFARTSVFLFLCPSPRPRGVAPAAVASGGRPDVAWPSDLRAGRSTQDGPPAVRSGPLAAPHAAPAPPRSQVPRWRHWSA